MKTRNFIQGLEKAKLVVVIGKDDARKHLVKTGPNHKLGPNRYVTTFLAAVKLDESDIRYIQTEISKGLRKLQSQPLTQTAAVRHGGGSHRIAQKHVAATHHRNQHIRA